MSDKPGTWWWLLPAWLLALGGLSFLIAAFKDSAGALVVTGIACTTAGTFAAANARRRASRQSEKTPAASGKSSQTN